MYKTITVGALPPEDDPVFSTFAGICWAQIDHMVAAGKTDGQKVTDTVDLIMTITRTWVDLAAAEEWRDWLIANTPAAYPHTSIDIQPV